MLSLTHLTYSPTHPRCSVLRYSLGYSRQHAAGDRDGLIHASRHCSFVMQHKPHLGPGEGSLWVAAQNKDPQHTGYMTWFASTRASKQRAPTLQDHRSQTPKRPPPSVRLTRQSVSACGRYHQTQHGRRNREIRLL